MCTATAVHTSPRQQPQQARKATTKWRRTEVFFCLKLTVFEIFLAITELMSYNIFLFYSHRFFFGCLSVFLIHRHFSFVVCRFFFWFLVFSGHRHLLFFFYEAFYLLHKLLYKFCPWFNIEHL